MIEWRCYPKDCCSVLWHLLAFDLRILLTYIDPQGNRAKYGQMLSEKWLCSLNVLPSSSYVIKSLAEIISHCQRLSHQNKTLVKDGSFVLSFSASVQKRLTAFYVGFTLSKCLCTKANEKCPHDLFFCLY